MIPTASLRVDLGSFGCCYWCGTQEGGGGGGGDVDDLGAGGIGFAGVVSLDFVHGQRAITLEQCVELPRFGNGFGGRGQQQLDCAGEEFGF